MKALDPARIYSLELLTADEAKQFFPGLDDKQKVLFVTTDDSEKGKKLKEKIDKTVGGGMIARAKNISITKGNGDIAPAAVGSGTSVSVSESSDAPVAVSSGDNDVNTAVVVVTNPKVSVKTTNRSKKGTTLTYTIRTKVNADVAPEVYNLDTDQVKVYADSAAISSDKQKMHLDKVVNDAVLANSKNVKKIYFSKINTNNNESTIDNFSNSLIIIDGKESKGLKNVPASDIKSITILKNESAEKLYGKRGRNGVIVITTKKGK